MGRYKDFLMESADRPRRDSLLKKLMEAVGVHYSDGDSDREASDSEDEQEEFYHYSPESHLDYFYEPYATHSTERDQEPAEGAADEPPEEPAEEEPAEEEPAEEEPAEEETTEEETTEEEATEEEATEESADDQEDSRTQARCSALEELLQRYESSECVNKALLRFTECSLHEEVKVLLKYRADPNYIGYTDRLTDYAPLHVAVHRRDAKMVEILMSSGASTSQKGGDADETPLEIACMSADLQCVRTLLEHGADVNAEDSLGMTPLMRLVEEQESLDVLELLLEKGADPNLLTEGGNHMEPVLYEFFQDFLHDSEATPERIEYGMKALRLLLRHGFKIQCYGDESLLELSLTAFDRLFPLAALLSEQVELCGPDGHCFPRFEVLQNLLTNTLQDRSEAEARLLVDKANALLDLLIEWPPMERFTLSPLQDCHQGALWAVDMVPASLQSLSCAFVRRALLPRPLEPKIEALPVPKLIQDLLKPMKLD